MDGMEGIECLFWVIICRYLWLGFERKGGLVTIMVIRILDKSLPPPSASEVSIWTPKSTRD